MLTQAEFLAQVEAYIARRADITATALGREAVKDPSFVFDLRRGRSPSLAIVERVLRFMDENPPSSSQAAPNGAENMRSPDEPSKGNGTRVFPT